MGGAYKSQSFSADAQICLNMMVEKDESGAGKNDLVLVNTPGLSVFCQLPDSPLRGEWVLSTPAGTRAFAISGSTLFEISSAGAITNRGAVANDGKPVSFASSNVQLMIASGGQGYCLTLATNALTAAIATIAGVVKVAFCDGFFAALIGNSAQWFVSNLLDGTTWNPGQTSIISVFGDNAVDMGVTQRTLCFFGYRQSVCYYDSGNVFPFDVVPGGFSEQGSIAPFGQVNSDNAMFGIWSDQRGGIIAFRSQGYTLQRISTHAIELEWSSYSTVSDAIAYSYQDRGHTVVVWSFPTADKTWAFDVATGLWHQKSFFQNGVDHAHLGQFHMYAFGKHLVGGLQSGMIYQMNIPTPDGLGGWNFVTDAGNPINRMRRSPYIGAAGIWNQITSLEVMADTGLGPNIPLNDGSGNSRGPQLMVRFSDDNGNTWSNQRTLDMGQIGQFGLRLRLFRLGAFWGSVGRIFEFSFTDPAPLRIVDADLTGTPDLIPQKRLAARLREQA